MEIVQDLKDTITKERLA
jgi:hypothetical protein